MSDKADGVALRQWVHEKSQGIMKKLTEQEIQEIELWSNRVYEYTSNGGFIIFKFEDVFNKHIPNGTETQNKYFHDSTNLLKRNGLTYHPNPDKNPLMFTQLWEDFKEHEFDWFSYKAAEKAKKELVRDMPKMTRDLHMSTIRNNCRMFLIAIGTLALGVTTAYFIKEQNNISKSASTDSEKVRKEIVHIKETLRNIKESLDSARHKVLDVKIVKPIPKK